MKDVCCFPGLEETVGLMGELKKLNKIGIDYACVRLIKMKPTQEHEVADVTFYSDEEWGKHYTENNYYQNDKIDRIADRFSSVCAPWYAISENSLEKEVSHIRENVFNIKNGFTVVRSDEWFKYVLSLASYKQDSDFLSKVGRNRKLIHEFFCRSSNHLLKRYF